MFSRRSFAVMLVVALTMLSSSLNAQMKTPAKPAVQAKSATIDINSAPEADIVALGIEKAAAKKKDQQKGVAPAPGTSGPTPAPAVIGSQPGVSPTSTPSASPSTTPPPASKPKK